MRRYNLNDIIDHMVDALQRDHETNALTWANLAGQHITDEMLSADVDDDDYWEHFFNGS